jgi:hypothetical protein
MLKLSLFLDLGQVFVDNKKTQCICDAIDQSENCTRSVVKSKEIDLDVVIDI